MGRTFFGLKQSPWTERARWALDHHRLPFTYHEHVPMLGEVLLRAKARTMHATVPLLAEGDDVVMGSGTIARHADRVGAGVTLFPAGTEDEVARWEDVAERMLVAGRTWFFARVRDDRAALAECVPSFLPGALRGPLAPSAGLAIGFLARKYDVPANGADTATATLRPLLDEARAALSTRPYAVGEAFTYADVVLAGAMHVLRPRPEVGLGPALQAAWTNQALATEYADLLAWRDRIYTEHRRPAGAPLHARG